jgi:hypothetical protein
MTIGLRIFIEISVFRTLNINFADTEMKLFTMMGYISNLSFVIIDIYLKSHGPRA